MSYSSQAALAVDSDLRDRIAACAATQGVPNPVQWADGQMWALSAAPKWADAYASARVANKPRPGLDEAVISDAMILAAVQPLVRPALP